MHLKQTSSNSRNEVFEPGFHLQKIGEWLRFRHHAGVRNSRKSVIRKYREILVCISLVLAPSLSEGSPVNPRSICDKSIVCFNGIREIPSHDFRIFKRPVFYVAELTDENAPEFISARNVYIQSYAIDGDKAPDENPQNPPKKFPDSREEINQGFEHRPFSMELFMLGAFVGLLLMPLINPTLDFINRKMDDLMCFLFNKEK